MLRDVLGDEREAEVVEELGYLIENIKVLGWREIRPWSEFFAVFKPPQFSNWGLIEQRLATNFLHYRSNYVVISLGLFVIRILFAPVLLFALTLCVCVAIYLNVINKKSIVIGDVTINPQGKIWLAVFLDIIILGLSGGLESLLWTILLITVVCGLHLLFRPRSVTAKTNKLYEELKLNGYSWFGGLNSSRDDNTEDPENPPHDDENYSGTNSDNVRKRTSTSGSISGFIASSGKF